MLAWRLQFDEDFPRPVIDRLEALGYHVRRLQTNECGRKDWDWLRWCRENDYVLCTCNVDEFRRHHHEWVSPEEVHCGVLAIRGAWTHEQQFNSLTSILERLSPNDVVNTVVVVPRIG